MSKFEHFREIYKKVGLWVMVIGIASVILEQYQSKAILDLIQEYKTFVPLVWVHAILGTFIGMLLGNGVIVLIGWAQLKMESSKDPVSNFWQYFHWNLKESLRLWGSVLSYGLLLVVPGVFKYIQLQFLSYIVLLNPRYASGEVDALAEAQKLAQGNYGFLFLFWLAQIVVSLFFASFDRYQNFWVEPIPALFLIAAQVLVYLSLAVVLLRKFRDVFPASTKI